MAQPISVGFGSGDWSMSVQPAMPNGCTWYRCILPANELQKEGFLTTVGFLGMKKDGQFVIKRPDGPIFSGHDIIVMKVIMMQSVYDNIDKAKARGQKIVVDIDDLFDELHKTNHAWSSTDPTRNPDSNREILFQIIEKADALICSTPFIQEYYQKKHPEKKIFMVRNSIDVDRWKPYPQKRRKPTIGWLGATPWRSQDLETIRDFFGEYIESRNLRFHHAGWIKWAAGAHLRLKVNPQRCTVTTMCSLEELPNAYQNFDIGIVPLNDIPFNRAKSYIKGLEYACAGVPFVATALPEYEYLSQHGVGRVARTPQEWMNHFDELLNLKIRQDEAAVNYEIVKEQFSISARRQEWIDVFTEISKM